MRVTPPIWYNPPIARWLKCRVQNDLPPQGYLVEVNIDGEERSIVAPYQAVRVDAGSLPADGELFVVVVAELPDNENLVLTELPAAPFNGSQRLAVDRKILEGQVA